MFARGSSSRIQIQNFYGRNEICCKHFTFYSALCYSARHQNAVVYSQCSQAFEYRKKDGAGRMQMQCLMANIIKWESNYFYKLCICLDHSSLARLILSLIIGINAFDEWINEILQMISGGNKLLAVFPSRTFSCIVERAYSIIDVENGKWVPGRELLPDRVLKSLSNPNSVRVLVSVAIQTC